jgi:hypothetical protein
MRKLTSIVFLLLVLIISLGVSVYMGSFNGLKEGLENEPNAPAEGEAEPAEGETEPTEGEAEPAEGEESEFDITPMEGTCAETMTNYN